VDLAQGGGRALRHESRHGDGFGDHEVELLRRNRWIVRNLGGCS
jgi:hypothetical protein